MLDNKLYSKLTRSFLRKWWLVIIVALSLIIGSLFVCLFFTPLVNSIIDSQLPLEEGSLTYDIWRKPPMNPVMKIYIYNVTNVDEFLNDKRKPILQELGPYTYIETWEKVNLRFHDNGTLTFNQRKIFKFSPELSNGTEDDTVHVPNIPLLSATTKSKLAPRLIRITINFMVKQRKIKPFVEVTVGQLLWGYEDSLLELAKETSPNETLPFDKFGLLYGKNGTYSDNVTIFTGADDIKKFGVIDKFNGQSKLTHWTTNSCNAINGTDGNVFPPHMDHDTTLHIYDKDLCRLMPLKYQKEVMLYGDIQGYRFSPSRDIFADISINPENECFCPSGPPCAPHGTFNISACQYDSPVLLSFPHFYLGDDKLRTAVDGMSPPDPKKHEFFADVQPEMGIPLRIFARLQFNLAINHVDDIEAVATFPDIVFPIMWFEDGLDKLPENITDLIKLGTVVPPVAKVSLMYTLFLLGAALLCFSIFCLIRTSNSREIMNLETAAQFAANYDANKKQKAATNGSNVNPAFIGDSGK